MHKSDASKKVPTNDVTQNAGVTSRFHSSKISRTNHVEYPLKRNVEVC